MLVVDVPRELQRARLIARDGITGALADSMLDAQASRTQRLAAADDVIANDGSLALRSHGNNDRSALDIRPTTGTVPAVGASSELVLYASETAGGVDMERMNWSMRLRMVLMA